MSFDLEKFDLEKLPNYMIIEFLERLPDDDLLAMCDQKISKKIAKICHMDPALKKRIEESGVGKIKAAWEMFEEDNDPLSGRMKFVRFTGNDQFDRILTKGCQVVYKSQVIGEMDPEGKVVKYDESIVYTLYEWGREALIENLNHIQYHDVRAIDPYWKEATDLLCVLNEKNPNELDIWYLILAYITIGYDVVFTFFRDTYEAANMTDSMKAEYQTLLDKLDGVTLEDYTLFYIEKTEQSIAGARKFLE